MARSTLLIAAIHNGELPQAPARELIDQLGDLTDQVIEIAQQPPFQAHADARALKDWRRTQSRLESRWAEYREKPVNKLLTSLGRTLFDITIELSPKVRENAWHVRQVERAVTAKHIAAWRQFHDSGNQELLVLESDAGISNRTRSTVDQLLEDPVKAPRYVNLAGGLSTDAIGISHLQDQTKTHYADLKRYRKPVTNTSCAYLVNQGFVAVALQHVDNSPEDAGLGIDWLFNAIFLDHAQAEDAVIECWHAEPPVIVHGSLQGVTKSWHPDR